MGQDGPKGTSIITLRELPVVPRPFLGPSLAILGLAWPFSGGPKGHLEAESGFGRADLGMTCDEKPRC